MDIILVGKVACAGALKVYREHKEELEQRYSAQYLASGLKDIERFAVSAVNSQEAVELQKHCELLYPVCNENLYEALWNLGESLGSGLRVRLQDIPISRFSIELGDRIDENPYLWDSTGCILGVTKDGNYLEDVLKSKGLYAQVIGYLTEDKARCVMNGTVLSYIGS